MNLVEQIKHQLTGSVVDQLSSVLGASEGATGTAVTAAVPAMLSALSGLASSSSGSQKLVSALSQFASSSPEGLVQKLSSQPGVLARAGDRHSELAAGRHHDLRDRQHAGPIRQHRPRGGAEAAWLPDAGDPRNDRVEVRRQVDERSRPRQPVHRPESQHRKRPAFWLFARRRPGTGRRGLRRFAPRRARSMRLVLRSPDGCCRSPESRPWPGHSGCLCRRHPTPYP